MAKQDGPKRGQEYSPKRAIDYGKAKKVTSIPEGYNKVTGPDGKTYFVKETETPKGEIPGTPPKPAVPKPSVPPRIGKSKVKPKPGTPPKPIPDTYSQDVLFMEEAAPEKVATNLDVLGRVEHKVNTGYSNPNIKLIEYPEAGTGGYTNPIRKYADVKTGIIQPDTVIENYMKTGEYKPVSEGTNYTTWRPESAVSLAPGQEVNKSSVSTMLSNTKNPVAEVGTKEEFGKETFTGAKIPDKSEQGIGTGLQDVKTLPSTELKDKSESPYVKQYDSEKTKKVVAPRFNKGGNVKGYLNGGGVTAEEKAQGIYIQNGVKYRKDGTPILTSGYDRGATNEVTSANTLPLTSGTEFTPSGNAATSGGATYEGGASATTDATGEKKQGSGKGQAVANKAGQALGAYGSGYWASKKSDTQVGGAKNAALGAVGQMGPVGGAVSGLAAIGTQIGEPIKEKSERTDKSGELVDEKRARRNAIIGGVFDGGAALEARGQYEGGYKDISGRGYTAHLEKKAKEAKAAEQFSASMSSRNERMEAAEGGTIVGKGGPKSDSILSKIDNKGIPSGSFIVPAENNGLAKKLREKFLGGNPEKKAQFKKEGGEAADVAVSNGEHLFTPKEKQKITTYLGKEILEELAPNAEENDMDDMTEEEHKEMMKMDMEHKAKGGELSAHKAKIMLHEGKFDSDKQRRFFGWVAGGRKACGGMVKKAEGGGLIVPIVKYKEGTPKQGVSKEFLQDFESKKKTEDLKERISLLLEYKSLRDKNDDFAKFRIKQIAKRVGEIENRYPDIKIPSKSGEELSKLKETKPSVIGGGKKSPSAPKIGAKKTGLEFVPKIAEDNQDYPAVSGVEDSKPVSEAIDPRFKQKTPLSDADAKLLVDSGKTASDNYVTTKTEEKPKWYSGLGSGLEYGASAAQIGMGLRGLNKSGKMPVDKIDPLFQASVDKAQAAAKFGFTPAEQFSIDQDRQNALNAARYSARNFAGGSPGTAFTQERSAINEGWGMGLKSKIANQQLMQDKQRYADTLALQKAGMSRQLFEDKLAGWNQQQQAGSALLGTGIRNLIGAGRYQKELEAQKQRQQYNG